MSNIQTGLEGGASPSKLDVLNTELSNYRNGLIQVSKQDALLKSQQELIDALQKNAEMGIAIAVKPTDANVQLENRLVSQNSNTLTAEDKFYESLGIKKSSGGWGIQSRPMGRILVAVVLVGGYFAYKKFKK